MATTFLWTFTVCLNELLDTYSDVILTATTFQWKVTVCVHELLAVQSDMIPDGNTILVDVYCVKWHKLLTSDENISVDIHSVKRQRQWI